MAMWRLLLLSAAMFLWVRPGAAQTTNSVTPGQFPQGAAAAAGSSKSLPLYQPPEVVATVPLKVTDSHEPLNAPRKEELLTLDPTKVEIRWQNNRWQLLSGGVLIKDLGSREADAREALHLIQEMHFTQRGTVGKPQPIMEYWLSDGQPPQGTAGGMRLLPIDVNSLRVDHFQGEWIVRDNYRLYFMFGSHGEEAQEALRIIRDHGFTRVGYVGQPTPALVYFLAGPEGMSQAGMVTQPSPSSTAGGRAYTGQVPAQPSLYGPAPMNPVNKPGAGNLNPARQIGAIEPLLRDQALQADKVVFDCRQVQVRRDNQDWKLFYGPVVLANFGPNQTDARTALNVLQFYRCNEQCLVGSPKEPSFTYYLSNGQPPRGLCFGMGGVAFHPETLTIRQAGKDWAIYQGNRPLVHFGDKEDDAKQLLQAIQQNKFDHICHIGHPDVPGMTLLVRTQ
jgi:hypothetical protein